MKYHEYKWSVLGKYRNELYGLSIISVILLHYFECVTKLPEKTWWSIVGKLYNGAIGSVGVDIFLFLSGFCIFYSLSKNERLSDFYLRRFKRVILPYLLFGIVFWFVKDVLVMKLSIRELVLDFSTISFWIKGTRTFWYVSFIAILYLISPALYGCCKRMSSTLICIAVWFGACAGILLINREYFFMVEIAILRGPLYILGMFCGNLAQKNASIPKALWSVLPLSIPLKIISNFLEIPFYRAFNGLYALLLIMMYILLRENVNLKAEKLKSILTVAGKYSFELYIIHVGLRNLAAGIGLSEALANGWYLLLIAISIPLSYVLYKLQIIKVE